MKLDVEISKLTISQNVGHYVTLTFDSFGYKRSVTIKITEKEYDGYSNKIEV